TLHSSSARSHPLPPRELRPRLCYVTKGDRGYGFHLHGDRNRGAQYIRRIEPGSPADLSGLRSGDRVVEVNGENGLRHAEVVALIKAGGTETRLLVVDPETDELFNRLGIVPTSIHLKGTAHLTDSDHHSSDDARKPERDVKSEDPFRESGLQLSLTAAEAKQKAQAKRPNKRAPPMDWSKKQEIFSNF
uniref:PDZ domain-containing protein n=1 Tax=Cyprinus carpio TaxID=7962 RepID=A0A8C1Y1T4_CYPCA